jgi:hypothetical protein
MEIDEEIASNFKKRYAHLHPLLVHRSVERAKSFVDLFEILEQVPKKYPVVWSEEKRSWVKEPDVMAKKQLKNIRKKK